LLARSFSPLQFIRSNRFLSAFLVFALLSVLWSDFPFIAFKRWFRDLGIYLAVLVALTDPRGIVAGVHWVFRRLCYFLIPLSILLIKYFPDLAKEYDHWTGRGYFVGVTTSKNMLGVLCLVSGLFFFWDVLHRWHDRANRQTKQIILVDLVFIGMTLWLIGKVDSKTSSVCLVLGCIVVALAHPQLVQRRPNLLAVLIPVGIGFYLLLQFGFGVDIIAVVTEALGRSPDLTGRTNIWNVVLSAGTSVLLGAGYESFWLGDRLLWVWERAGPVNQAHNGYLELYLNLGALGLALLMGFLLASYGKIARTFKASPSLGSLGLAMWAVLLFYNFTEAAFRGQLIWVAFLLVAIAVPDASERLTRATHSPGE